MNYLNCQKTENYSYFGGVYNLTNSDEIILYAKQTKKFRESNVPILGSYMNNRPLLDKIKALIETKHLIPIIIDTLETIKHETPRQKIYNVLANAKFVIADDTYPCGEMIELEYCRNIGINTAIICKKNVRSSWLTWDFEIHSKDFKVFVFKSEKMSELGKTVVKMIKWSEKRNNEKEKHLKKIHKSMPPI